jgi:hypothetical protein
VWVSLLQLSLLLSCDAIDLEALFSNNSTASLPFLRRCPLILQSYWIDSLKHAALYISIPSRLLLQFFGGAVYIKYSRWDQLTGTESEVLRLYEVHGNGVRKTPYNIDIKSHPGRAYLPVVGSKVRVDRTSIRRDRIDSSMSRRMILLLFVPGWDPAHIQSLPNLTHILCH